MMARFGFTTRMTLVLLCGLLAGCQEEEGPAGKPVMRIWESPESARTSASPASDPMPAPMFEAPAPMPSEDAEVVIAAVNGKTIRKGDLVAALIEQDGLRYIEDEVLLIAAKQRASEMGVTVTSADIRRAHDKALEQLQTPIVNTDSLPIDRSAAERLLSEFLGAKNISRAEWDRRMEQRAYFNAIAEAEISERGITEDELQKEYARSYGERVQIRHVQVASLAAVDRARAAIVGGRDFELVAREMSENAITAANGGLLPPFARDDPAVSPLIRQTAFGLEPGQISAAVHEGGWYHLIRLEQRFPASGVGFENVDRAVLERRLRDRLIESRLNELEEELFVSAAVDIRDPVLRRQFQEKHRRNAR